MQVNLTEYNSENHRDYMSSLTEGGIEIEKPHFIKGVPYVFTLEIGKTNLVFKDIEQLKEARSFFEKIIRPSTVGNPPPYEHHWHIWYGRLPKNVLKDSNREKILKAISKAIIQYENTYSL